MQNRFQSLNWSNVNKSYKKFKDKHAEEHAKENTLAGEDRLDQFEIIEDVKNYLKESRLKKELRSDIYTAQVLFIRLAIYLGYRPRIDSILNFIKNIGCTIAFNPQKCKYLNHSDIAIGANEHNKLTYEDFVFYLETLQNFYADEYANKCKNEICNDEKETRIHELKLKYIELANNLKDLRCPDNMHLQPDLNKKPLVKWEKDAENVWQNQDRQPTLIISPIHPRKGNWLSLFPEAANDYNAPIANNNNATPVNQENTPAPVQQNKM